MKTLNADVVKLQETCWDHTITNAQINQRFRGWLVAARQDRQTKMRFDKKLNLLVPKGGKTGGGVAILTKEGVRFHSVQTAAIGKVCQVAAITIKDLRVITSYITPKQDASKHRKMLKVVEKFQTAKTIYSGDINCPTRPWEPSLEEPMADGRDQDDINQKSVYNEFVATNGMEQFVKSPTHAAGNLLDVVFVNCPEIILGEVEHYPNNASDHEALLVNVKLSHSVQKTTKIVDDLGEGKADWKKLNKALKDVNMNERVKNTSNANSKCEIMRACFEYAMSVSIPKKTIIVGGRPGWEQSDVKTARNQLKRARKKVKMKDWIRSHDDSKSAQEEYLQAYDQWQLAIEKCKNITRLKRNEFEDDLIKSAPYDNLKLTKYIKKLKEESGEPGPLKDDQGNLTDDNKAMADLFLKQFMSTQTPETKVEEEWQDLDNAASNIPFKKKDVALAIKKLKPFSAAGPDGLKPIILQKTLISSLDTFYDLLKTAYDTADIPNIWQLSLVFPLVKPNKDRTKPSSYRPISLTCVLLKVLESIINATLSDHLEDIQAFNDEQHGFRRGRSTTTNMLNMTDLVTRMIESGSGATIIYLDQAAAFDKMPFSSLAARFKACKIEGKTARFLTAWLTQRYQKVVVGDSESEIGKCTSGVPQGSSEGPQCYCLFYSSQDELSSHSLFFADDAKLVVDLSTEEGRIKAQKDLDRIHGWAILNHVTFSIGKCKAVAIGNKQMKIDLFLGDQKLEYSEEERDLGIQVTSDGKFNKHVAVTVQKATNLIYLFKRNFRTRSQETMKIFYNTYIQPTLMYASQVWMERKVGFIQAVDGVFKRFWKLCSSGAPTDLLLPSQFALRQDLLFVHKMYQGQVPAMSFAEKFTLKTKSRDTRSDPDGIILMPRVKTEARRHNFFIRIIKYWNLVPYLTKRSKREVFTREITRIIKSLYKS